MPMTQGVPAISRELSINPPPPTSLYENFAAGPLSPPGIPVVGGGEVGAHMGTCSLATNSPRWDLYRLLSSHAVLPAPPDSAKQLR